jgi:F-type H+-transporting ATPase subunit b
MDVNATFIGQIVVFLVLWWFVAKFVIPPVKAAIDERAKKIADGLAAADRGQQDLAEAKTRANDIIREARERAKLIEDQAAKRSNEAIEASKQTAAAEGARIVTAARTEAATETGRARDELRKQYGGLVVAGASALLEREVDARAHAQLLDKLAEDIVRG